MLTTHEDVLNWLAQDERNVEMFLKRVRKIMKERIVLIADNNFVITIIKTYKRNSRKRR